MRSVNLQSKQTMSSNAPPASLISTTCEPLPMELKEEVPLHKKSSHGMDSQSESNLPTPYFSAPSSPARSNTTFTAAPCFFDFPTSPGVAFSDPSPEFRPSPAAKSAQDDFEFEMGTTPESPCNEEPQNIIIQHHHHQQQKIDVPTMSFADELFSNGRLRPLKLPPRLQGGSKPSPRVSSPSRLRGTYRYTSGQSLKNKDFDPFAAALEEIRKEDAWFEQAVPPRLQHRRTQSVAPLKSLLWSCGGHGKETGPSGAAWQVEWVPKRRTDQEEGNQDVVGPAEPRLKLVPIEHSNVMASAFSGPAIGRGGHPSKVVRRWRALVWWSKRKISSDRQILSASDRWAYAWGKKRDPAAMESAKDELSPRFGEVHGAQYNVEDGAQHRAAETKALTKYKPNKLLLCFGLNS